MPKLFGVNIVAVLVGAVAFYIIGFLWYGVLFHGLYMNVMGLTEADFEGQSPMWMVGGGVIPLFAAFVIAKVLAMTGAEGVMAAASRGVLLWVGFGLTGAAYGLVYTAHHSWKLFLIDASHLLVGWVIAAVVIALLSGKAKS